MAIVQKVKVGNNWVGVTTINGGGSAGNTQKAQILLSTPNYNAILTNSTGHYIEFTFDTIDSNGVSIGEGVTCTYTITRGTSRVIVTEKYRYNTKVKFGVDKYLNEGENSIVITIVGDISGTSTSLGVTYQVVDISIESNYDISNVVDLSKKSTATIAVPFSVSGYGTKTVEWYIDGSKLDFVKSEDEIVEVKSDRVKYITISNLQQGTHSLQMVASVTINGEKFYTPILYKDIIVYTGVNKNNIIAVSMEIPSKYGIANGTPTLYNVTQYSPYILNFATYSPTNKDNIPITISLDEETIGTIGSKNNVTNEIAIVSKTTGDKTINIKDEDGNTYTISTVVNPTTMTIGEITSGLKLDFSAFGRSNNSIDKDIWSFGEYTGTFSGFKWNSSSGWVDNSLKIDNGSVFSIDYAPLSNTPTNVGRTLEFEFKTTNVNDDNTVICDLRNDNGVGLLITATKVTLMSEAGVVVENEFRAGENVRLSVVINKSTGSSRKCLSFIYANGCVSRCVNWESADSYNSDTCLSFVGSAGAEVILKYIRIYETALSDDQILNNYIIYRDSVAEMMEVYDRNDVYAKGTTTFSPDKMVSRLPVMVVTGDIPTLENTSDKDTQVIVDIEYTNMQDPSRSFKMVNAAMRPQGTSSMGYPKKNFRIYTQKVANTILYDANGKVVQDKLYSFKEGAIPVDCWCLKADYAESSGTHNTGIARMWNNALYNMQIDGEYVCRTDSQKAAIAAGYEYDVRTTIDGFPILLFYKKNATDEPIFIGKYNFNNDKSTEKVFGFTDIPGFDNSRMQCWEVLNNGNSIGLFTDISNFYNDVTSEGKTKKGWEFAFESRYPDTKSPNTEDLYNFAVWMNGVNGDHERFTTEKWDHFKVYPMAAYYCYLMRHAAADQLVKNAMLTSEDGEKFYFILYDNDTINGLNNIGEIDLLPTDDRNSVDESGQYKFAGHSSVLWNMLEADEEFMQIVKTVDDALYSAGISYNECIRMFDEEQAEKWVERVYNQDSEYKYVGPFVNNGINNLEMLQGRRDLHRRWWLSKRFSIYDAKFVSGEYKSQAIELKCQNDTTAGQSFTIKAGYPLDYGYGINDVPRETGVTLAPGESHTFTTAETVNLGDPIRIYGSPNIQELDLSAMANRLSTISVANVYTDALGTRLEKLIIGGEGVNNLEVSEISGLKMAKKLTHLNIMGMKGIKALDLTSQPYFEKLSAVGSEIASVSFAKGAPVTRLELPTTMKVLNLEQLPYLTTTNLVFADITGIHTINVKGCPNLANDFSWVNNWYNNKATADNKCTLVMEGINWAAVSPDDLLKIAKIGTLELKGKVVLSSITLEQLNALITAFGESAFDKNADFYINAPDAIFVSGRTELLEGESEDYNCIVFGGEVKKLTWSIYSGGTSYTTLDSTTGVLTTTEGIGNHTITIRTTVITDTGTSVVDTIVVTKARKYPSNFSISGPSKLENELQSYEVVYSDTDITGDIVASWSLSGMDGYAIIEESNDSSCVVRKLSETNLIVQGTLSCTLKKRYNGSSIRTVSISIEVVNDKIAETDKGIVTALYNAGLCANSSYILKEEAMLITAEDLVPGTSQSSSIFYSQRSNITSFEGFQYFTAVVTLPNYLFCSVVFKGKVVIPSSVLTINSYAFYNCISVGASFIFPNGIPQQDNLGIALYGSSNSIKELHIPDNWTHMARLSIDYCNEAYIELLSGGKGINSVSAWAFSGNSHGKQPWMQVRSVEASNFIVAHKQFNDGGLLYVRHNGKSINGAVFFIPTEYLADTVVYLPYSNCKFPDGASEQPLVTTFTNGVYSIANSFDFIITIKSNMKDAKFNMQYTTYQGETVNLEVSVGENAISKFPGGIPQLKITALTEYDGYVSPSYSTTYWGGYTGTSGSQFTLTYKIETAVYIQHIDGTLYTKEEWPSTGFTSSDVNGIAFVSAVTSFVYCGKSTSHQAQWCSTQQSAALTTVEGVPRAATVEEALEYYDGKTYSKLLLDAGVAPAATANNYVFPNGNRAYLPTCAQLQLFRFNAEEGRQCAKACGIGWSSNTRVWTSILTDTVGYIWAESGASYFVKNPFNNTTQFFFITSLDKEEE